MSSSLVKVLKMLVLLAGHAMLGETDGMGEDCDCGFSDKTLASACKIGVELTVGFAGSLLVVPEAVKAAAEGSGLADLAESLKTIFVQ